MKKIKLVFMSSTLYRDPQTKRVIKAIKRSGLNVKISLIIGDKEKEDEQSKKWARKQRIPLVFIETKGKTIDENDIEIISQIEKHGGADLVFLIGWMKFLGSAFLKKFKNKAPNIHPSLLPSFTGLMDWKVHEAVIDSGVTVSGCTLHFVDETVDGGLIILQKIVYVRKTGDGSADTPATLRKRVQKAEIKVIVHFLKLYTENRVKIENNKVIILPKSQTAN